MGQIYEKKKTTDVVQSSFRVTQLANNVFDNTEELKRNAEREKAEAFDVYSKGLHLSASQSMADMFNENQNDPEKLQEMFNGLNDKMSAEIPDIETKIGFKADFFGRIPKLFKPCKKQSKTHPSYSAKRTKRANDG